MNMPIKEVKYLARTCALKDFPEIKQHNLCSTATHTERTNFIADVIRWYNVHNMTIQIAKEDTL